MDSPHPPPVAPPAGQRPIRRRKRMWAGIALLAALVAVPESAATPPHIISIIADDLGWGSVGFHRNDENDPFHEIQTPNIDALATGGIILDRMYAHHTCSPSRCSFQTGRLPVHVNIGNESPDVFNPEDPMSGFQGIPRNFTGIASKLKEAGYQTHFVGKWDAGMAIRGVSTPVGRGFDSSLNSFHDKSDYWSERAGPYVDLFNTYLPAHTLNGTSQNTTLGPEESYLENVLLGRLNDILVHHDPTFPLFVAHNVHVPSEPLSCVRRVYDQVAWRVWDDYPAHSRANFACMVKFLDDIIGNITVTLKAKGMWENTLLTFHSDNGGGCFTNPNFTSSNFPLRGSARSTWEGGIRVVSFLSGGYLYQAAPRMMGRVLSGLTHVADFYATFCEIAGVNTSTVGDLTPLDSISMWPYWRGEALESPRSNIHVDATTAIVDGFKIMKGSHPHACWSGPLHPNNTVSPSCETMVHCGDGCLFHVLSDPGETRNIADENPVILKELQEKLAEWNTKIFRPFRGLPSLAARAEAERNGGFWVPFAD